MQNKGKAGDRRMDQMLVLWIAVLIVTIVIEAATLGLTTIWFTGGAFAALIVEMFHGSIYLQVTVFLIVSLILLCFTRPLAVKYFNREREKTNLDSLIGKQAVVTATIENMAETGQVIVEGKEWTARSNDVSKRIETGMIVRIVSIQGVKLFVEAVENF